MHSIDTIVAIATAIGRAGIGVIRLSGPKALEIACLLSKKKQEAFIPRQAIYSTISNNQEEVIDQVILVYFKAPHSFTGEDIVEIHGHGSPVLLDYVLSVCITYGARLARPGEFSERAFLNDKMDLVEAEAIADLIASQSLNAAQMAVRSLQGDFSNIINVLNEDIIRLRIFIEAAIDFPEEEIDFFSDGKVGQNLDALLFTIKEIQVSAKQGVLMREGMSVVIAGKPNAGKSTLINYLAGRDIAIVTDVAGTTRDVMREYIAIDELPIHIIDTAGLRESDDIVEKEGVKRAWLEVEQADCVLLIIDMQRDTEEGCLTKSIQKRIPASVPIIKVYNKIDINNAKAKHENNTVHISAKTGEGIALLKEAIKAAVGFRPSEGKFIARRRHLVQLDSAEGYLKSAKERQRLRAFELVAEDLRLAHMALCDITGEFSSDDLLGEIFSSFCIGK